MHGPDVGWYLVLAAMLFVTGAFGVLMRRSPLIILLSVEIMLNAVNLTFIAFGRAFGTADGQIIVFFVMTVAAAEAAVRGIAGVMFVEKIVGKLKLPRQPSSLIVAQSNRCPLLVYGPLSKK